MGMRTSSSGSCAVCARSLSINLLLVLFGVIFPSCSIAMPWHRPALWVCLLATAVMLAVSPSDVHAYVCADGSASYGAVRCNGWWACGKRNRST